MLPASIPDQYINHLFRNFLVRGFFDASLGMIWDPPGFWGSTHRFYADFWQHSTHF